MAPLWKSMLSKSSPLYRDSLFSFSLAECRAQERELAWLRKYLDRERRGLHRQLEKLSKELQQKDQIIESLRAKASQRPPPRPDTPSSGHALSHTTDQSDGISFVSDEQGSTNEDLELCSEMGGASEYDQDERPASTRASIDSPSHSGHASSRHPSIPPSTASSHGHQSSLGSLHKPVDTQTQTGFSVPQTKAFPGYPMTPHSLPDTSTFHLPPSYQLFHPSPLGGSLNGSPAMKAGAAGLLESSALWDVAYGGRPMRMGADVSSGSSGYQSGTSHTGSDLMKEHLREIRSLRQRLEDSIHTNDRLRQQLEDRLASTAHDKGAPTNIYIQGLDSVNQLSGEIRALREENLSLQTRLQQASREGSKEAGRLQEEVLQGRGRLKEAELEVQQGRGRLKEAELEAERWAEQGRRLQAQGHAHALEVSTLRQERQAGQEAINRLQHQVALLQQQLCEGGGLVRALQGELQMYRRVCGVPPGVGGRGGGEEGEGEGEAVPFDPRHLHVQLEQQLSGGLGQGDTRPHARRQLFHDSTSSPPVRDTGFFSTASPPALEPQEATDAPPALEGQAPDGSFASLRGRHALGHVDDFTALQQQVLEGGVLVRKMEAALQGSAGHTLEPLDPGCLSSLLVSTKTLRQILDEASSLLRMFWRAALPSSEGSNQSSKKEQSLKEEVHALRRTVSEQEEALRDAMERLRSSNRTKDSMEHYIVSQLSRTRDVLKTARTNLEGKTQEASVSSAMLLVGVS